MNHIVSIIFVLLVCVSVSFSARAQHCPEPRSPSQTRQFASEAFSEGQRLYDEGNFASALRMFECSNLLLPHQNTLFNIAECHEALNNFDEALRVYRSYIETYPNDSEQQLIEQRIRELEDRIGTDQSEGVEVVEERDGGDSISQVVSTRMSAGRKLAWVTLGLGLVLSGVGTGFLVAAASQNSEFVEGQTNTTICNSSLQDVADRGQAFSLSGIILMGVGALSLVTSIVSFIVFDSTVEQTQVELNTKHPRILISPLVFEQGAGMWISSKF